MSLSRDHYQELLQGLLAQGLVCEVPVHGRSMLPTIKSGDVVTVAPLARKRPRAGDILVTAAQGALTCHRLVFVYRREGQLWLQTWGDAGLGPDQPVPEGAVLGEVTSVRSEGRELSGRALRRGVRLLVLRRHLRLRFPRLASGWDGLPWRR